MGNWPSSFSDPIYPIKRSVTYQALAIPSIPTSISALFLVRRVADATLGKNPDDGLYFGVLLIVGTLFASGGRCALITRNHKKFNSVAINTPK